MKVLIPFLIVAMYGCASPKVEPPCVIPVTLPLWQELVLRRWAGGSITDMTFIKNFAIVGESGERVLKKQGYEAEDMKRLGECILEHFKKEERTRG